MSELAEERRAVAASIREEGLRAVMFEEFGVATRTPRMLMWRKLRAAFYRHSGQNLWQPAENQIFSHPHRVSSRGAKFFAHRNVGV